MVREQRGGALTFSSCCRAEGTGTRSHTGSSPRGRGQGNQQHGHSLVTRAATPSSETCMTTPTNSADTKQSLEPLHSCDAVYEEGMSTQHICMVAYTGERGNMSRRLGIVRGPLYNVNSCEHANTHTHTHKKLSSGRQFRVDNTAVLFKESEKQCQHYSPGINCMSPVPVFVSGQYR